MPLPLLLRVHAACLLPTGTIFCWFRVSFVFHFFDNVRARAINSTAAAGVVVGTRYGGFSWFVFHDSPPILLKCCKALVCLPTE